MRVLLIEDDDLLGQGIQTALSREGYTLDWLREPPSTMDLLKEEQFGAILLDLSLPKRDGIQVLKEIRHKKMDIPVLIMTARDAVEDRVLGLNEGADDYLVKPFDVAELCARLRALMRRSVGRAQPKIQYENVCLYPDSQKVIYNDQEIPLSRREFMLLQEFLMHAGKVFTREQLEQMLYGWGEDVDSNAIEVHIHHLRKKLYPELIKTIRGVGYIVEKMNP